MCEQFKCVVVFNGMIFDWFELHKFMQYYMYLYQFDVIIYVYLLLLQTKTSKKNDIIMTVMMYMW
jgi:hypothetical protein